jgi:tRNA(His) 5'-end guanylyltransferase
MKFNTLEEKCKYYQSVQDYKLMPNSYVLVHCDGRAFSKLIKKRFKQPFDDDFIFMMNETAKYLCENVGGCKMAYVQSDEISLVLTDFDTETTDSFFGYRMCKLISTIAAMATAKFNRLWLSFQEDINLAINELPLATFDCKVWNVPNYNDAIAWFIFRQNDCIKNSVSQTAQILFTHKELEGVNTQGRIDKMLCEKGINWEDFDNGVKYGRFIYKVKIVTEIPQLNETTERYAWQIRNAFKITENKERFNELNIIPKME